MNQKEEMKLRELAGGRCAIQSVIDVLGPMSLWSKDGLKKEIEKAIQEDREKLAKAIEAMPFGDTASSFARFVREYQA